MSNKSHKAKTQRIHVRLADREKKMLDELEKAFGLNRSDTVRTIVKFVYRALKLEEEKK